MSRWGLPAAVCAVAAAACAGVVGSQLLAPGVRLAHAQQALATQIEQQWAARDGAADGAVVTTPLDWPGGPPGGGQSSWGQPRAADEPADGAPIATLRVPSWGAGPPIVVVQGIGADDLAAGPGHYPGTAMPGATGNFAVAGHRGPVGAPFNGIDRLRRGDVVVVETADTWNVYRVTSHEVVAPDRVDVIAPVPGDPGATPTRALLTLTACHPRYSSAQRYIVHAELAERRPKAARR